MDSAEKVAEACKDMEQQKGFMLSDAEAKGVHATALISIAISLKRIADSMQVQKVTAEYQAGLEAMRKSATP